MHSAADTEYDGPFYGQLMGAYFASHPAIRQVTERVENRTAGANGSLINPQSNRCLDASGGSSVDGTS